MFQLLVSVLLLLGSGHSLSIPEEIQDVSMSIQRGMRAVEARLVEGFRGIGDKMDKIQDVVGADTAKIDEIWNMTNATKGNTDVKMTIPQGTTSTSAAHYDLYHCGKYDHLLATEDMHAVIVDDGEWKTDLFCSVLSTQPMQWQDYSMEVDLFNHRAGGSTKIGHLGIMYNAVDHENYDFVYIRPHNCRYCYQTGALVNGALDWNTTGESSKCPKRMRRRTWFHLKVVVKGDVAKIYLDGDLVKGDQKMMHASSASGGVVVANGYENVVYFKNFRVSSIVEN